MSSYARTLGGLEKNGQGPVLLRKPAPTRQGTDSTTNIHIISLRQDEQVEESERIWRTHRPTYCLALLLPALEVDDTSQQNSGVQIARATTPQQPDSDVAIRVGAHPSLDGRLEAREQHTGVGEWGEKKKEEDRELGHRA